MNRINSGTTRTTASLEQRNAMFGLPSTIGFFEGKFPIIAQPHGVDRPIFPVPDVIPIQGFETGKFEMRSQADVAPVKGTVKYEFPRRPEDARKGDRMKRTRFSEEQIGAILKQSGAEMKTAELCRQNDISEATFYSWKAKYGGMAASDVQKLKRLEDENAQPKRVGGGLVARQCLAETPSIEKLLEPASKRSTMAIARQQHGMSERRTWRLTGLARFTQRRRAKDKADDNDKQRLQELA